MKVQKAKLGLNYKFSHRPINIDWKSLLIKRVTFAIMTTQNLLKSDLLLNIGEWSLSNNTKTQRSWSKKGSNFELKSIISQSLISVTSCVASIGWHFSYMYNSTINSGKMVDLFSDIFKFIKLRKYEVGRRLMLIMNNATIHKPHSKIKWMKDKFDIVLFLAPYIP